MSYLVLNVLNINNKERLANKVKCCMVVKVFLSSSAVSYESACMFIM